MYGPRGCEGTFNRRLWLDFGNSLGLREMFAADFDEESFKHNSLTVSASVRKSDHSFACSPFLTSLDSLRIGVRSTDFAPFS